MSDGFWKLPTALVLVALALGVVGPRFVGQIADEQAETEAARDAYEDCLEDPACDYERAKLLRDVRLNSIPDTSFGWLLGVVALMGLAVWSFISWAYHPTPPPSKSAGGAP